MPELTYTLYYNCRVCRTHNNGRENLPTTIRPCLQVSWHLVKDRKMVAFAQEFDYLHVLIGELFKTACNAFLVLLVAGSE